MPSRTNKRPQDKKVTPREEEEAPKTPTKNQAEIPVYDLKPRRNPRKESDNSSTSTTSSWYCYPCLANK